MTPRYLNTIPELSTTSDDVQYSEEVSSMNNNTDEMDSDGSIETSSIDVGNSRDDYSDSSDISPIPVPKASKKSGKKKVSRPKQSSDMLDLDSIPDYPAFQYADQPSSGSYLMDRYPIEPLIHDPVDYAGPQEMSPDLPLSISNNIEEIDNSVQKLRQHALSKTEQDEYFRLEAEYQRNDQAITQLRNSIYQLYSDYSIMQQKQIDEVNAIQKSEEDFLNNYEVGELSEMKKEYTTFFKKRQQTIISQIEDKYEKPVKEMYSNTQSVLRNMNRSIIGKIIFTIVWIIEYVCNWLKDEWKKITTSEEEEEEPLPQRPVRSLKRTKKVKDKKKRK